VRSFEDYYRDNRLFSEEISCNLERILRLKSTYEHKQYVEGFERDFARYNGSQYTIAVNSGTTALELALKVSGVHEQDEVILPAYTYISTALAVSNLGAVPVFVDINKPTFTIDPNEIVRNLTDKTKAIITVHIHGNPCDMDKVCDIARENNLAIIEDGSHAHGAEYGDKKVGNFGIGCFSCHSSKTLSGIGNSGLITTNDSVIAERIRKVICVKNDPSVSLSNRTPCTMDVTQAAVLKAKLPYLDKMNERKRKIAARYIEIFPDDIRYQMEEKNSKHVYRDFVISTPLRDMIKSDLERSNIETKIRYQTPLHTTKYYKKITSRKSILPITEDLNVQLLCLPIAFSMTEQTIEDICGVMRGINHVSI